MSTIMARAAHSKLTALSGMMLLVAIAAPAAAEVRGDAALAGMPHPATDGRAFGEASASFKVAGKIGAAATGAAASSRELRDKDGEKKVDATGDNSAAAVLVPDDGLPSGPFKIDVPGQSAEPVYIERPKPSAPPPAKATATPLPPTAAVSATKNADAKANSRPEQGPVRTLFEQGKNAATPAMPPPAAAASKDAKPAAPIGLVEEPTTKAAIAKGPQSAPAVVTPADTTASARALPADSDTNSSSCLAGCYETTAARTGKQSVAGAAPSPKRAAAPAAKADDSGLTCVAGCDGIDGKPLTRAPAALPDGAGNADGTGRITVLRGVTRTRAYGTGN